MPYVLPCRCGSKIQVQKSQAGSRVECPQCRLQLEIPTIRGLSKLEFEEEAPASDKYKSRSRSRWTPLRGVIAATCFVVALIGLGRSCTYGVYRFSHPTDFTVDEMLDDSENRLRELSPIETWDYWRYLQETGLGSKKPPQAFVVQRVLQMRDQEMKLWAGVGAVGLLGLIATSLWPSSRKKPT